MALQNGVLAEAVRDHFRKDSRICSECIGVEVCERHVVLVGCVATEEQKQLAEEIAKGVSGVRHVENHVTIRKTADV